MSGDQPSRKRRRRGKSLGQPSHSRTDELDKCFGSDRARIRGLIRRQQTESANRLIEESMQRVVARAAMVPKITYPEQLPFTQCVDEIKEAIDQSQVVVLCGETGSGKSTQLPKLLLEMGRGVEGLIGHTQPRRLAARAVADRISDELGVPLGHEVGYKVRFGDHTDERTLVKLMTDGILLAETRSDRLLEQYDTIIIDEAHERSLNIDFLLGYLTQILPKRPDLKVVITSATIDAEKFAEHFEHHANLRVPILEISGRTYPVDVLFRPVEDVDDSGEATVPRAVIRAIEELSLHDRPGNYGDVLVFLPGEREIREVSHELRKESETNPVIRGSEILPLYARLSPSDQQRIFKRTGRRKVVLSTNVAETSLTVPGIRYVIDAGVARMNRYSSRRKIQSLQIEPISRASARQRAGRCGRTEPGVCVRLYSETDHDSRDEFTSPEIMRTNLAGVILQMQSLKLGLPQDFPFVEPPDIRRINDAYDTLHELNAMDEHRSLTPIGKILARLPVDPRIGRILYQAKLEGVLADGLVIASFLEVRDPRDRPFDKRDAADNMHAKFKDKASDFVTVLRLWKHYHDLKDTLSRSQLRKQCVKEYLSYQRMREWTDTHRQLRDISKDAGLSGASRKDDPDGLHRAVMSGSLSSLGKKHHEGGFAGSRGGRFYIHPSSAVAEKGTKWIVAAELVRTTRLYARSVSRIDPSWIETVAGHLIVREYTDPRYIPERGRVEASATVRLWDLIISKDRLVDYSSVDQEHARQIFIEAALVDQEYETDAAYCKHNQAVIADSARSHAKLRQSNINDRDHAIRFYSQRLPEDISTAKKFDRWRRKIEEDNSKYLFMCPDDLGIPQDQANDLELYPDVLTLPSGAVVDVQYTHDPGGQSDGASMQIPVRSAAALSPDAAEWLVPGWLPDKVESILRGLPKDIRRQLDIASVLASVVAQLRPDAGEFYQQLARAISAYTNINITPEMCKSVILRDHQRVLIDVMDDDGKTIVRTRDPNHAVTQARKTHVSRVDVHDSDAPRLTAWPKDPIPTAVDALPGHANSIVYPALFDMQSYAQMRKYDDPETARYHHYFGVRRIAHLELKSDVKRLLRHTPHYQRAKLGWVCVPGTPSLENQLAGMVCEYSKGVSEIRNAQAFAKMIEHTRSELAARLNEILLVLLRVADAYRKNLRMIDQQKGQVQAASTADVSFQMNQLVHSGTLSHIPLFRLKHMPRYLDAITVRLEHTRGRSLARETEIRNQIMPHWKRCIEQSQHNMDIGIHDPHLESYRWLIEEYRVALYAQRLGVATKVSERVLNEHWARVQSI